MPGQAIVTIRDKQWQAYLATTYAELTTGLRGLSSILPGTGVLFVLPQDQTVTVTTRGLYFPIDIIFISSQLEVVSVAPGVLPNVLVTESTPARYFLEVNAGEVEGIESGDAVSIGVLQVTEATDWIAPVVSFAGVMMVGAMMVQMSKKMTDAMLDKPKVRPVIYGPRGEQLLPQTVRDAYYWTAINKDTGEVVESHMPYTSSGRALRGGKAWVSRHWRKGDTTLVEVWKQPYRYSETLKIEPVASELLTLGQSSSVIPTEPRQPRPRREDELEFLPDSPEFLAYTIEDIGYRDKLDNAFQQAIARAKELR